MGKSVLGLFNEAFGFATVSDEEHVLKFMGVESKAIQPAPSLKEAMKSSSLEATTTLPVIDLWTRYDIACTPICYSIMAYLGGLYNRKLKQVACFGEVDRSG